MSLSQINQFTYIQSSTIKSISSETTNFRGFFGAGDPDRTGNPFITNELLYRLSHTSIISYICAALEHLLKQRKTEQILHQLANGNQQNVENPRLYSQLSQIREEMLGKPGYDWSVSEICQLVNVSRSYLQRMYKKYFGRSIFEELIHARLNEAKKLLTETNTSITKIAELCGYASYSHFANQFKAEENMTPSQYREQKQKPKAKK